MAKHRTVSRHRKRHRLRSLRLRRVVPAEIILKGEVRGVEIIRSHEGSCRLEGAAGTVSAVAGDDHYIIRTAATTLHSYMRLGNMYDLTINAGPNEDSSTLEAQCIDALLHASIVSRSISRHRYTLPAPGHGRCRLR